MTQRLPRTLLSVSSLALTLAIALSTPLPVRAQPNWQGGASIAVAVLDKSGGPIVGATVTLHRGSELAGPGPAPLLTDREGHASFSGLADGEWVLEVTHPEFMAYRAYLEAKTGKEAKSTFAAQVATNQSFSPMRVSLYKSRGPAGTPVAVAATVAPPAAPAPPAPPPAPPTPPAAPPASSAGTHPAPVGATAAAPPGVPGDSGTSAPPTAATPASRPPQPAPAPRPAPVAPVAPAPAPSPAPAPAPPAPAVAPPAPMPAPAPPIVPAPVTPASPVAAAPVRSAARSNCPECKPGESALAVDSIAGPAAAPGDCTSAVATAARAALRDAAARLPAASPAGVFVDGNGFGLGLPAASAAALRTALAAVVPSSAACRLLAVTLPVGAKYLGYRYDASDTTGSGDCMQGQECPIKRCGFAAHAAIEHGANGSVVWVLFENRDPEHARRAELVVYYRAASGATP